MPGDKSMGLSPGVLPRYDRLETPALFVVSLRHASLETVAAGDDAVEIPLFISPQGASANSKGQAVPPDCVAVASQAAG
ncbi:MAG: hypothetical protein M3536_10975 [Actinomycetota bacterium]|jgi:hypothetical protein|nr:hypothetical protein [Actinomycetota bacterium]